ncbi:MAG TPA: lysoplasmalogenase [Solimonas sp.]|nr:lysoplasmalogenase [Solimonas sp.]
MLLALACAAVVSALLAIQADWTETKPKRFLLLKPLTTILIAGIAVLAPESEYRTMILIGLGLSLVGDIALMFAGNAAFITGLGSFLLAHLLFMAAFLDGIGTRVMPWWAYGYAVYGAVFATLLLPKAGKLKIPVLLYGAILTGMALTASIRWESLGGATGTLALVGASLFVISDSALGARKFLGSYRGAQGLILSTYWLAIGLIAASALSVGA